MRQQNKGALWTLPHEVAMCNSLQIHLPRFNVGKPPSIFQSGGSSLPDYTYTYTCILKRNTVAYIHVRYSQKYWRELNLAVESQIAITSTLTRLKFGGLVQDHHTYICEEEILADFNLAIGGPIAKPPSLNHHQIFRLYGTSRVLHSWVHVYTPATQL